MAELGIVVAGMSLSCTRKTDRQVQIKVKTRAHRHEKRTNGINGFDELCHPLAFNCVWVNASDTDTKWRYDCWVCCD